MSVPNQTPYNIYTANGLTTVFAYEFYLISASDIQVTINGSEVTSGYTVSGVGNTGGGEITFLTAPANGATVIFERATPTYRLTDYQDNGDLLADTVNKDFDRLWMAIQRAFIYLGVALSRPLFGGEPFNATGYRIANLADPVNDQDAATKSYVDFIGAANLRRTLRFPDDVNQMPSVSVRGHSLQGYNDQGQPVPVFSMTDTADLALRLASETGAGLSGFSINESYDVATVGRQFLNQFKSEQHVQFYYDILGDWDEAIFLAQLNVYLRGFSPKLVLPSGVIELKRPILGGSALGDYIHSRYPDLGFYNGDGTYKATWPLHVVGVYKKHQDGAADPYNGTQIVFRGCDTQSDATWQNYGVLHAAPENISEMRGSGPVKIWQGTLIVKDVNIRVLNKDESRLGRVHGMVSFWGAKSQVSGIMIYQAYGAGLLTDYMFDAVHSDVTIIQCGRMSPLMADYISAGNVGIKYQTYAPLHVLYSPTGTDNSNFLRFENFHFEDNYHAVADIIVSGDSSPVHIINSHHETDKASGVPTIGLKKRIACGNVGVRYLGQDSESGFDYTAGPFTARGGFVHADGVNGYSYGYDDIYYGTRYTGAILNNIVFPNGGSLTIIGGNESSYVIANNCIFSDVTLSGGNNNFCPLKMSNCKATSITLSYAYGFKMSNVEVSGAITLNNMFSNARGGCYFNNVSAAQFSGIVPYGSGDLTLTSESIASNVVFYFGDLVIPRYAYYNKVILGGAS